MRKLSSFCFTLVLLLLSFIQLSAQDKPDSKISRIKIYLNGFYRYAEGTDLDDPPADELDISFKKEKYDFGNLSIAIELVNNRFFDHEFELMPIRFSHDNEIKIASFPSDGESWGTSGGKSTMIESAFRYQVNHYFNRDKLFVPQIALASQLYYNYSKFVPATSRTFPITEQNIGLLLSCVPGLIINMSKKLAIDLNIPFGIYNFRLKLTNIENPAIFEHDQKNSKFIGDFIPDYINIRLGIIYKLK